MPWTSVSVVHISRYAMVQSRCITRFAELESVVALTMILQKYKVTVKEELEFAGETFEQRRERILKARPVLTLT